MIPSELLKQTLGKLPVNQAFVKELGFYLDSLLKAAGPTGLRDSPVGPGGGAAPYDAQYLTLATDTQLSKERVFTPSMSVSGADAGANGAYTVTLVGDSASPGNSKRYGTNASGTKGWYSDTAPIPTEIGQIIISEDGSTWIAATPVTADEGGIITTDDGAIMIAG